MALLLGREAVWWSSLVTYSLVTVFLAALLAWFIKRQKTVWMIEKLPGPPSLPIIGNALDVNVAPRDVFQTITGVCYMLKRPLRVWLGPRPLVLISTSEDTEVLLSSPKHLDKSRDYNFLHPWLGTGLLTSTGNKWHSRRKLLTPAFHFKILEDFVEVFNGQSNKMVQQLTEKADGKAFDIFTNITLCTLDIICETAMGININAQDNSDSEYVNAVYRIGALVQYRQTRPWIQPDFLFKLFGYAKLHDEYLRILHGFSYSTIENRRRERELAAATKKEETNEDEVIGKKKRLAFLDLLLNYSETQTTLTNEDIREEVDTFMFEGHDTTAAAINWSVYLLGCHPEIQAKLHEELDALFGDSDRPVTMADLREMKYTENCIKEALRLFPSVPFLARELREEAVIDNHRIPVGTTVMVVTYRLHRDPEQFPDPERFDPDRFLPENVAKRHPYSYVPFSAGPRNCIGQKFALMEEKIVLSSIMRNFRVESTTRREDLRILGELILRPENGNVVKLFPRSATVG
uniref:Cytochrome P450 CYP4 n=1 Tax=Eriocheir sinensis TaxID=95602 RepID=A0A288ZBI1_ERISI|nr:cytochrome P450 CYP4 [Eriocheir sinensis]